MAVLEAPGRGYDRILETGIRPFDISRDLRAVAELIAVAFSTELDDRGNAALREMRLMSHFSGFLSMVNRSTGEFNDMLNGYVWVDNGRVVGNITVQRADKSASRWQIANVAVDPDYRGRGISRRLMETAVEHIQNSGGQWAVLQVYARNSIARNLYESMGFEALGGITDLRIERIPHLDHAGPFPNLTVFRASNWQPLYELANYQLGAQAQWWRAIRRTEFQQTMEEQFGEWFHHLIGRREVYRRAAQVSPRFEAALILDAQRWRGEHLMQLWARPESYGRDDAVLLRWALAKLQDYPRWPVNISLSTEHKSALELLDFYGFQALRTLLTMRMRVDDAPGA